MRPILSPDYRSVLQAFVSPRTLLAFDFDGTLAPIVNNPQAAQLRPQTRQRLGRLCQWAPCVILSGRSQADLRPRLQGLSFQAIIGNHGLEPNSQGSRLERRLQAFLPPLYRALEGCPGLLFENKRYSLSIHYRHAPCPEQARAQIYQALARLKAPMRLVDGHYVVNVLPRHNANKGTALTRILSELGLCSALFIGDDVTDEDVFRLTSVPQLLGIRVGACAESCCSYYIESQSEIDSLLDCILQYLGYN